MRIKLSIFVSLVISSCSVYSASINAIYVETPPRIDGKVNDPAWQEAAVISEFIQREPDTGEPASEQTTVYICYDKDLAGMKALKQIGPELLKYAKEVKIIDLPFGG